VLALAPRCQGRGSKAGSFHTTPVAPGKESRDAGLAQGNCQRPRKAGDPFLDGGAIVAVAGGAFALVNWYADQKTGPGQGASKEQIEQIQKPLAEENAALRNQMVQQNALLIAQNQKLMEIILVHYPSATPETRQAASAAVQSVGQGANQGNPRLQQAIAFLNQNNITEAMKVLSAAARNEAVQAQEAPPQQKERKEADAAAAYRNLGAIAGLADPKKAREAYAKALELDPDDRESLYWHGWLSLLAGHFPEAENSLERLLKLAIDAGDQRGIYRANLRRGELAKERGNLAAALKYEERAKKIGVEQSTANPSDTEWQRDLSVSYEKIDDVLVAQGNLPEALKNYREDLAMSERLAKFDPGNAQWQRDLSVSYDNVGGVQEARGDREGALKILSRQPRH